MGSFKVKLVVYFLLLSLLPIGAAFWGFTEVAGQSETRQVDARLQSGMRALLAAYQERLDQARNEATVTARSRVFQAELANRDLPVLVQRFRNAPEISVTGIEGFRVGRPPAFSATRSAAVVSAHGLVGTVTVAQVGAVVTFVNVTLTSRSSTVLASVPGGSVHGKPAASPGWPQ